MEGAPRRLSGPLHRMFVIQPDLPVLLRQSGSPNPRSLALVDLLWLSGLHD